MKRQQEFSSVLCEPGPWMALYASVGLQINLFICLSPYCDAGPTVMPDPDERLRGQMCVNA